MAALQQSHRPARSDSTPSALIGQTTTVTPVTGKRAPTRVSLPVTAVAVEYRQAEGVTAEDIRRTLAKVHAILFGTNSSSAREREVQP